ncbi:uncharacterized protein PHACADRAFT_206015 [Phanerochaete carnosa HHB-10118-sp]|uniref:Cytochrome P450 n=1 Tax=Phanerochaete carnosa (strain HHB-10118-sp) TaxID=650164 RepID=K5WK91_PHACS|nr:uncharacterized protein PHACADRAFT_206015 [Phanerochaete carnosa HHB-10118-sp]EKM59790.1 hypothetical protein PHACADRAFT_206015 [Phanerochaete carnosa HHB-10118-sp]
MSYMLGVYVVVAFVALVLYKLVLHVWSISTTPLRHLPGPPSKSLLWGNNETIKKEEHSVVQERWAAEYGQTIAYQGAFGRWHLWTMDPRALHHVLTHPAVYKRSVASRFVLSRLLGPGLLVTEDEQHKQQRRVLSPAFGPAQVRALTEVFVDKSNELRDCLLAEVSRAGDGASARVDANAWLTRATLDIIGLAGFGHDFASLTPAGRENELGGAMATLFTAPHAQNGRSGRFVSFLQATFPLLRLFKTEGNRRSERAQAAMRRIGMRLIAEKKAAILEEKGSGGGGGVERKDITERDLLTLLIRANMATDIPESQRLTDDEVLAQVPTFIVAGHETTSTATTWALFALAQRPHVQSKLREELLGSPTDSPTMDELNALPYLDAVVRETLRFHSPVPKLRREVFRDDVIPVDTPYTDRHGRVRSYIEIRKGDTVNIPILAINRRKELWGEDAHEFRPERWENIPEAAGSVPGVWANLLTFSGGHRACIGFRFSIVETKALLFALIRGFEFELAVPAGDIEKRSAVVTHPVVVGPDGKAKRSLPVIIKPVRA